MTVQETPPTDAQAAESQVPVAEAIVSDGKKSLLTEEVKTEEKPVEGEKKDGDGKELVPEKYEFKLPDGVTLDEGLNSKFQEWARSANLTQEQAQMVVDMHSSAVTESSKASLEQWHKTRDEWQNQIKTDKEFGGSKLGETIDRAKRTLEKFGDPELFKMLDETGLGDNPGILKLLARVDRKFGEDSSVDGTSQGEELSLGARMFPSMRGDK
jgi:hypothetical protein